MLSRKPKNLDLLRSFASRIKGSKRPPGVLTLNDRSGTSKKSGNSSHSKFKPSSILMLAVPGTAFALGCWQVRRLQWKQSLIADLEAKLDNSAVDFPVHSIEELEDLDYHRVKLRGRFLYDREFVIAPRGRFDRAAKKRKGGLAGDASSSSHGGHVITPFQIENSDAVIMVNRGWVPPEHVRSPPRHPGDGTAHFEAIVRRGENRPQFVSENMPEHGIWYYKNHQQMAAACGACPVYVEMVYEATPSSGLPIAGQTNVSVANDHLNYLVTWFSLSAITTVMWFFKFCR